MLLLAVHVHFLESYCVRDWKVYTSIGNLIFVWWVAVEIWSIWKSKCLVHLCLGVVLWRGCLVRWGKKHPSKKKKRFYKYCPRPKLNINFPRAERYNSYCDMVFSTFLVILFRSSNCEVGECFIFLLPLNDNPSLDYIVCYAFCLLQTCLQLMNILLRSVED